MKYSGFSSIKQIDSILPGTFSVKMASNVVRTKTMARGDRRVCHLMFLPYFDFFCDLLLNRRTATWNLLVFHTKETKHFTDVIPASVLQEVMSKNQSKCENHLTYRLKIRVIVSAQEQR